MGLALNEPGPSHGHGLLPPPHSPSKTGVNALVPGEGWGGGAQDGSGDRLQHALPVCHDFVIVEPQYPIAFRSEECITLRVALHVLVFVVLSAINLNDEPRCVTHKVDNEWTDRSLPAEAHAMHPVAADRVPDDPLGISQVAA